LPGSTFTPANGKVVLNGQLDNDFIPNSTTFFQLQLDKPDPEIDRIWADEARKRWTAYKAGGLETVTYDKVMDKYRA